MSLNPITAIEKLINEHGSATILRERLVLASEEFTALERKTAELTLKVQQLETENETLRAQCQQRAAQIHALEIAAQEKRSADRSEIEQRILIFLASGDGHTVPQVAQQNGISNQTALFHLNELIDAELVFHEESLNPRIPITCHLSQSGRRHLIQRGLLP